MKTIHNGGKFQLNHDGTALVCGYETCRHIDLVTGVQTPWPLNGTALFYPGGWFDRDMPVVFVPTQSAPPMTVAQWWNLSADDLDALGKPEHAIGHGELAAMAGQPILSTNGQQIFRTGVDITPEPFAGVVSDGQHYGYKRGWDGSGPFVVRRVSDNLVIDEIDRGGMYERPYTLSDGVWITGWSPGGSLIDSPGTLVKLPPLEREGPVVERAGVVYVVSAVMGAQNNPRGVMVRPWAELLNGSLKGWYVDGVRHQQLQARVRGDGTIVVAGAEFPGSGLITIADVDVTQPMALVPPEIVDPEVDPPTPDPAPIPPVLLVSAAAGTAPLTIQATAYNLPPGPRHWQKRLNGGPWLDVVVTDGNTHFYEFHQAGIFNVRAAVIAGGVETVTNFRLVTVAAPPPEPEPEPEPPPTVPRWAKVLAAIRRWWASR